MKAVQHQRSLLGVPRQDSEAKIDLPLPAWGDRSSKVLEGGAVGHSGQLPHGAATPLSSP